MHDFTALSAVGQEPLEAVARVVATLLGMADAALLGPGGRWRGYCPGSAVVALPAGTPFALVFVAIDAPA